MTFQWRCAGGNVMKKKAFSIFPKKLANGNTIYYYTTYDDNNKRRQFSTGKVDKLEAMKVCLDRMASGTLVHNSALSFREYTKDWFNYDKSCYIQSKLQRGFSYSHSSADKNNGFIHQKAIPFFGDTSIACISPNDIEAFLMELKKSGQSHVTINHELKLLKLIFGDAVKKHIIRYNPTASVMLFKNDTREKGIFSESETEELFNDSDALEKYWNNDRMMFAINYLAYKTGMRIAEIQALRKDDIDAGCIDVKHSWDSKYGLKSTKTGKSRIIPMDKRLQQMIAVRMFQAEGNYIFSMKNGTVPLSKTVIYKGFYAALERIGLTKDIRKERNITFHSWRHTFASVLANRNVPEVYIRKLTGHASQQVLNTYTHIELDTLKKIVNF